MSTRTALPAEAEDVPHRGSSPSAGSSSIDTDNANDANAKTTEDGIANKKKKRKIRPKLKPITSEGDGERSAASPGEDLFGNFSAAPRPRADASAVEAEAEAEAPSAGATDAVRTNPTAATVAAISTTTPKAPKLKPRPSSKLKPRSSTSTLFSPRDSPRTPDDDDYDAFGFGLVKHGSSQGETQTQQPSPKETLEVTVPHNASSEAPLGQSNPLSPLSLRRAPSCDSYISDDSYSSPSSSEESALLLDAVQRNLMRDEEAEHVAFEERKFEGRNAKGRGEYMSAKYFPKRTSAAEESQTSSLSLSASALGTESSGPDNVHMIQSYHTISHNASFSSDSSGESSYFSAHRGPPRSHQTQPLARPSYPSLPNNREQETPWYESDNANPSVPLASPPKHTPPPLRMRSNSSPPLLATASGPGAAIELKLSLSEEEELSCGRKLRSEGRKSTPSSRASGSSDDDQVISNELSAYSSSGGIGRGSTGSLSHSGRKPPLDDHRAESVLATSSRGTPTPAKTPVKSFFASSQSALAAASQSAAKPRANHDTSFLANLREGWVGGSAASVSEGSFIASSPRGAFGKAEAEERSAHDASAGSSPSNTPQSNIQSLAYSDEEDVEHRSNRRGAKSCLSLSNVDEAEAPVDATKVKAYPSRWIMLSYVALLGVLSDWTCFSAAPVSVLTAEAYDVDPENLVSMFLAASVVGAFLEPALLGWLGLRKTVLLGALLLAIGNGVKAGGAPGTHPLEERSGLYVGFFFAGASQPLYQMTSTFVIESWFPEWERSFASSVTFYSNMLGVGMSFLFGALLVKTEEALPSYNHLLAVVSAVLFVGAAMQFDEAPLTPSSETGRIIRGTVERPLLVHGAHNNSRVTKGRRPRPFIIHRKNRQSSAASSKTPLLPSAASFGSTENERALDHVPSSASDAPTELAMENIDPDEAMDEFDALGPAAPPPTGPGGGASNDTPQTLPSYGSTDTSQVGNTTPNVYKQSTPRDRAEESMPSPFPNLKREASIQSGFHQFVVGPHFRPEDHLPPSDHAGAEPIMIQSPRHFDIEVRRNQILMALKACYSHRGFSHSAFAFATSGVAANTLLTFMDSMLVALKGADQGRVGVVGASFQMLVMISSMWCGRCSIPESKLSIVIVAVLTLGGMMLALCDANFAGNLLWPYLAMSALLLGPVKPLSTRLGVKVAHPLSENTVHMIQKLLSNATSAVCIPVFKELRGISASAPEFTISLCFLVSMHALTALYFASFDVRCLSQEEGGREKTAEKSARPPENAVRYPRPKPPLGAHTPWGKKYPFLIPSTSM